MLRKLFVLSIVLFVLAVAWLGAQEKLLPPAMKDDQKKMEKAEKAMKNKDPASALVFYQEVMQAEPNYAPAYLLAAAAHRMKHDNEQALALLEKAIQVQPGFGPAIAESVDLLNRLAHEMSDQNQPEKAFTYYARIASLPGLEKFRKPALIEATYNMGISAFQAQRYEQSAEAFSKMLAFPNIENEGKQHYVLAQYMMGVNLSMLNKPEDSSVYLRKYLELADSDATNSFAPVASFLLAKYEYSLLEKEVEKFKGDPAVVDLKARTQESARTHGNIPELLQKALAARPEIEDAYVILSNYYYYARDLDRAIAVCKALMEKFPASVSLADYRKFLKKMENEKKAAGAEGEKK
jgi:tetratricopeptide (TPR) repeat protein